MGFLIFKKNVEKSDGSVEEKVGNFSNFFEFSIRPDKHTYFLDLAMMVARRSTCLRTAYGAIAVLGDQIVSTGYNGSRRGAENCCDRGTCLREGSETRSNYHLCSAIHAECNTIYNTKTSLIGATMYIAGFDRQTGEEKVWEKAFPCVNCFRAMIQAGIEYLCIRNGDGKEPYKAPIMFWSFLEE